MFGAASFAAEDIKIGVMYDYTGPFAGGGSKAAAIGNKIAIDMINEKGGVEGHKIVGIYTDAQSKTDVAINETERLLNEQKVDVHHGRLFERAMRADGGEGRRGEKDSSGSNVCVSSAVFKDKNLQYVFRADIHSDQYGDASCTFVNENAKSKLGKEPKDLKIAIIYEDGPYGDGHRAGKRSTLQEFRHADRAQGSLYRRPRPICRRW